MGDKIIERQVTDIESFKPPNLNQDELNSLNEPITSEEMEIEIQRTSN